jgi:AraC-like DNA-binding protein
VVLNSPTIAVALENTARYLRLYNEAATVAFVRSETRGYLHHQLHDVPRHDRRHQHEYGLTVGVATIRLMAGSDWRPLEVHFEHEPPARTHEHTRVFGAPVLFRCEGNALVMEGEFCDRHVPASDRRLYPILEQYLERQFETSPADDRFAATIRSAIENAMRDGEPRVGRVASAVGVSVRTLERRLAESGLHYKTLVDDIRRRLALRYLRDHTQTLSEVAYLLGYSELSAFTRAFKRWTGVTPSAHRRAS